MKLYQYKDRCNLSGPNIKRLREERGFSQEELAAKMQLLGLEINQNAISRVELGYRVVPDYELLYFARVFEVSVQELLTEQ